MRKTTGELYSKLAETLNDERYSERLSAYEVAGVLADLQYQVLASANGVKCREDDDEGEDE